MKREAEPAVDAPEIGVNEAIEGRKDLEQVTDNIEVNNMNRKPIIGDNGLIRMQIIWHDNIEMDYRTNCWSQ